MDKYDALFNKLLQPNSHSVGVMKLINKYYPSFAKKVLENNPVMRMMAMYGLCSMDILVYPICNHCETLAAYSNYARKENGQVIIKPDGKPMGICTCWKCGRDTANPITFKEWCMMELKRKAPETLDSDLDFATDAFAERCMADAERLYNKKKTEEKLNVQS
jgi:hypothetical protein